MYHFSLLSTAEYLDNVYNNTNYANVLISDDVGGVQWRVGGNMPFNTDITGRPVHSNEAMVCIPIVCFVTARSECMMIAWKGQAIFEKGYGAILFKSIHPLWKNFKNAATGGMQICKCTRFLCDF